MSFLAPVESKKKMGAEYYYISGTDYQRLQPGHTTETDFRDRTIISSFFTDQSNWTIIPQCSSCGSADFSKYIKTIDFDEEAIPDGGGDGLLTLQEALNAVWTQYSAPNPDVMQSSYTVDGLALVVVNAASSKH